METKQQAIDILDQSIAYINKYGFTISNYQSRTGECCYIGTLRVVDGIDADPGLTRSSGTDIYDGARGGSAALRMALNVLDNLARPPVPEEHERRKDSTIFPRTGRAIEVYGFTCQENGCKDETKEALKMLRKAKEVLVKELSDNDVIIPTVQSPDESNTRDENILQLV